MKFFKKLGCIPFTKIRLLFTKICKICSCSKNVNTTNNNNLEIYECSNNVNTTNNNNPEIYERMFSSQAFGFCPKCKKPNSHYYWCKNCYSKKFKKNFGNWTSENVFIDKFIQELQLNARNRFELLEWILYDNLRNIKFLAKGGFSTVYEAIWLDGLIDRWDYKKCEWIRETEELDEKDRDATDVKNPLKSYEKYGYYVALKSLDNSSNMDDHFLNEVSSYY